MTGADPNPAPSGERHMPFEQDIGSLATRTAHLERGFTELTTQVREGFASVGKQIEASRTPSYQLYAILVPIILTLCGFVWFVVTDRQNAIALQFAESVKANATVIDKLADRQEVFKETIVSKSEFAIASERSKEFRDRINEIMRDMNDRYVPRGEWNERTKTMDSALLDHNRRAEELRQDLQSLSSSLGSGKDTIEDLRERLKNIEARVGARSSIP